MQLTTALYAIALLAQGSEVVANPLAQYGYGYKPKPSCPADKCFSSIKLKPSVAKVASAFCSEYIKYKPAVTTTTVKKTSTYTSTVLSTSVPPQASSTITTTIAADPATTVTTTVVTSTTEGTYPTVTNFRVRGQDPGTLPDKRAALNIPSVLGSNCGSGKALTSKISSACSCYLGPAKKTTSTSTTLIKTTITVTSVTTSAAVTTTITATATSAVVTETSTSTTVTTTFPGGAPTCGIAPAATVGDVGMVSCTAPAPPGETNSRFRIEGGSEGNVFDGCIISGPRNITTPSGGTHICDGTNNNANPFPGSTFTTTIDSSGRQEGFGFDGTYSNQFQDFFISSISQTTQTGNQFWGVLRNRVFTARGGCQEQSSPADEALWAFDAFAPNRVFLSTSPEYQVVRAGDTQSITVTILAGNPNSGNTIPAQGATFGTGTTAGSDGSLQITVPSTPGCYMYKAELSNAIRSNTFYLTVVE